MKTREANIEDGGWNVAAARRSAAMPAHRRFARRRYVLLALLALSTLNFPLSTCFAQTTAFTYQGRLLDNGSPVTGIYDLQFALYDASNNPSTLVAGPVTNSPVAVTNGLFTVQLDFGGVFDGSARWLDIGVRTNGSARCRQRARAVSPRCRRAGKSCPRPMPCLPAPPAT